MVSGAEKGVSTLLNDKLKDELPASNYYEELDVEAWKRAVEPYNMTATLYYAGRYCQKCSKPSKFISVVTGPNNNNFISYGEFCSEQCATEYYLDVKMVADSHGYPEQNYAVKML